MLLFTANTKKKVAFVETKNLDGETNLKPKTLPEDLREVILSESAIKENLLDGILSSERPSPYINSFKGSLSLPSLQNHKVAIDNSNIL